MMRTDFESTQSFEVCGPEDTYNETGVTIGLQCTARGYPGSFNPIDGGCPPEGPEFELTTISVSVPHVNYKGVVLKTETLELTYEQFRALVGEEVAEKLLDNAIDEAIESGEFG